MQFIVEWIRTIIVFLLLATVLHMILPNSNLQKYVKFVVSLLLIVLILTPLFKLFHTDIHEVIANFNQGKYMAGESLENSIDTKKKEIQDVQHAYILEQMAVQMEKQVEKELEKQYGMTVVNVEVKVPESTKEVKSQQDISAVIVTLAEKETSRKGAIEAVQIVEINTDEPEKKQVEHTSHMKQYLSKEWQLGEDQITVQIEGGIGRADGQ